MSGAWGRIGIVAGSTVLAAGFAWLNAGERVTLRLGVVSLRAIPLAAVVFAAILLGMALIFLGGLRADLRTRRMLRRYREALGAPGGGAATGEGEAPTD
ncbi:MAG: hypothetical protein RRA92_02035 [Gemmatimonadota bacterium]|nr:hypothetical protein [Gemmatimonadota bacterium]